MIYAANATRSIVYCYFHKIEFSSVAGEREYQQRTLRCTLRRNYPGEFQWPAWARARDSRKYVALGL
jgi:hypothetical protein